MYTNLPLRQVCFNESHLEYTYCVAILDKGRIRSSRETQSPLWAFQCVQHEERVLLELLS